jgi:hypothetical protein
VPELPIEFDNHTPGGQNDVASNGTATDDLDRFMPCRHRQTKGSQLGSEANLLRRRAMQQAQRATPTIGTVNNCRVPLVALTASPPHLAIRSRLDILRAQRAIKGWMPLSSHIGQ